MSLYQNRFLKSSPVRELQWVAAELVAAKQGAGIMIMVASCFQNTDLAILGVILIGVIGFGIDMLMRQAERQLEPWKGNA